MTFRRKPDAPRRDVAAEITNLIIEKLEAGVLPWSRPWGLTGAGGRPLRHCGTPYTGINTLYLWAIGDARGYNSRTWMTYRQAEELGGQVRRGERGSLSVYFSSFSKMRFEPTKSFGNVARRRGPDGSGTGDGAVTARALCARQVSGMSVSMYVCMYVCMYDDPLGICIYRRVHTALHPWSGRPRP